MTQPTSGGTYLRDPETGELTLVQAATAWAKKAPEPTPDVSAAGTTEPAPITETETETPAVPGRKGKAHGA
ncbi:hypothetical protein [Pararhizobium gei]|uniref:hypothetical protein n=1 Tax=Pararhizobium gei TaxID=1395951 RepID=UPI0023DAFE69|nr:hypothetical protein [Rhizobium gei]